MKIELHDIEFSAVHFIVGHEKCGIMHGHNWKLSAGIEGTPDETGMMIDFSDLKKILRKIIKKYDHRVLIPKENNKIKFNKIGEMEVDFEINESRYVLPREDCVLLPIINTTCEELAMLFWNEIHDAMKLKEFKLKSIEVFIEEKDGQGIRYKK